MQDAVAIAVAVAAGLWIVRTLWVQIATPSCCTPANPVGADGFVPLDRLAGGAGKASRPPSSADGT